MNKITIGLTFAILSTLFYAIMDSSIKLTLQNSSIPTIIFYSHVNIILLTFLTIVLLYKFKKEHFTLKVKWYIMLYRGVLSFLNFYLAYVILKTLPLDIYYSMIFTVPSVASILSVIILKEKLSYIKITALAIGLFGVFVIINPFDTNLKIEYIKPISLALVLTMSISLSMITTKQFFTNYNNTQLSFYIFLIGSVIGIIISSITNGGIGSIINFNYNIFMAFVTAGATLLGVTAFIQAYKNVSTHVLAPTEYLFIIWGILLGKLLFNDVVGITTIIGACIVIASNILIFMENKK